jgi:serine/threonine protein phosphatase PrpC
MNGPEQISHNPSLEECKNNDSYVIYILNTEDILDVKEKTIIDIESQAQIEADKKFNESLLEQVNFASEPEPEPEPEEAEKNFGVMRLEKNVRQLCKGQDEVICGEFVNSEGRKGMYIGVYDGHGTNACINIIRNTDQSELMSNENPVDVIIQKIEEHRITTRESMLNSGSTFVYAKIYTDNLENDGLGKIEIGNVGDSQLVVFINGECVFKTTPQTADNPKELERLLRENRVNVIKPVLNELKPVVHDEKYLIIEKGTRCNFRFCSQLVPSQSLGHVNYTGYDPEYKEIKFDLKKDHVKIVCASDGLWDMLDKEEEKEYHILQSCDANGICEFAENRWRQSWKQCFDINELDKYTIATFPENGYDDVGVSVFEYGVIL